MARFFVWQDEEVKQIEGIVNSHKAKCGDELMRTRGEDYYLCGWYNNLCHKATIFATTEIELEEIAKEIYASKIANYFPVDKVRTGGYRMGVYMDSKLNKFAFTVS